MKSEASIPADILAGMIDHTLLKPEALSKEVEKLCAEANEYKFAAVCVNPGYVFLARNLLKGSSVKVCTVVGFPLGASTTRTKIFETEDALANGAEEIDMVMNIGRLKSGDYSVVREDIRGVVSQAQSKSALVKVIIEACLLTDAEKEKACLVAKEMGANFVKTSTGFSKGGAVAADVSLMRRVVGNSVGVKAAGGIRSYQDAVMMIESGANRIGTSSGVKILLEADQAQKH